MTNDKDIGPPGKGIKPTVERIDLFEKEDFREKEKSDSKKPMNRKGLFHQNLI
jgi:hypothetical protein